MNIITVSWVASIVAVLFFDFSKSESSESILTVISEGTLAEDGKLNFTQLVHKYGHNVEQHDVVTEDGYILTTFHIPGEKPPVLLFHGLADSADTFLLRGNTSLGITLANSGYDVWFGNNRGNLYGRRHVSLNPDTDKKFWDYSFHEIGYYDLGATIDFVREQTVEENISVIGHSQGTTAGFVLSSTRPEYNKKIKVFIALGAVAFFHNLTPQLSLVAAADPAIIAVIEKLVIEELFKDHSAVSDLLTFICSKGTVSYAVCTLGALFPLAGFDPIGLEPEFLRVIFGHYPAGCSRKSLEHYDQVVLRGTFGQFDYGESQNMVKYGTTSPPDYDLSAVTMNVALLAGDNDGISNIEDVKYLRDKLANVYFEELEPKLWSHLDFVWRREMSEYLYPSIFKLLTQYNN